MPSKRKDGAFRSLREQIPALDAYLTRIGAEERNFKTFVVKEYKPGNRYFSEKTTVRVQRDLTLYCSTPDHEPSAEERKAIEEALKTIKFPHSLPVILRVAERQAEELNRHGDKEDVYLFQIRGGPDSGKVSMLQHKFLDKNGVRQYVCWSWWGADVGWLPMEPDRLLPFWKPISPRRTPTGLKMIHEGAKTAKYMTEMLLDKKRLAAHPWGEFLGRYEHWGMIGGAQSAYRTDYAELKAENPNDVIYVCDRDDEGEAVLQQFSELYREPMKGIMFTNSFPLAWDMAEPIPEQFFTANGDYVGDPLRKFLKPATWATDKVGTKGRPSFTVRQEFAREWVHSVKPSMYFHIDLPNRGHSAEEFNDVVRPYSGTKDLASLFMKFDARKTQTVDYDPSKRSGIFPGAKGFRFNTHVESGIVPRKIDPTPFLKYLDHLVPVDEDRLELKRWCATFLARPGIKMKYGVLAISESQGTGKSTLGEHILGALVGEDNFSTPLASTVVDSQFNTWLARKRLAVINEIYEGHNAKAYNKLMSVIADKDLEINEKHVTTYQMRNWIHVYACSNYMQALKFDNRDRRWFIPEITEDITYNWDKFYNWLEKEGGLSAILYWANEFLEKNKPVTASARAPGSRRKDEIVRNTYSAGTELVADTLDDVTKKLANGKAKEWLEKGMATRDGKVVIIDKDLMQLIAQDPSLNRPGGRASMETALIIRKLARDLKWFTGRDKIEHTKWGNDCMRGKVISNDEQLAALNPTAISRIPLNPLTLAELKENM